MWRIWQARQSGCPERYDTGGPWRFFSPSGVWWLVGDRWPHLAPAAEWAAFLGRDESILRETARARFPSRSSPAAAAFGVANL